MIKFRIGDNVLFISIKNGKRCGYEEKPYKIIKIINIEKQNRYFIENEKNKFWTNDTGIILDMEFRATNNFFEYNVFIEYADGRTETISENEYFIRYAGGEFKEEKTKGYEQVSIFDLLEEA